MPDIAAEFFQLAASFGGNADVRVQTEARDGGAPLAIVFSMLLAIWYGRFHNKIMKVIISMDASGRLVLPKRIRQSLNAPRSAIFEAEVLGNRLELTLTEPGSAGLRRKGKLLVVPKQGVVADAVKAVEDARKERL
jgi:hypothetical protein